MFFNKRPNYANGMFLYYDLFESKLICIFQKKGFAIVQSLLVYVFDSI